MVFLLYSMFFLRCRQADVFSTVLLLVSATPAINVVATGDKLSPVATGD
jgi:hypothetical protein